MTPLLLVVGEFWENVEEYRRTIKQLGLDDQVIIENRFVPNEELGRFFAAADAFVAPYTSGTQSAAIKTAMSFGLPVLASDQIAGDVIGGMHPVTLHRAGDVEDLTDSIRQFLAADRSTHVVTPADTNWQDLVKQVGQVVRDVAPCGESYGKR
jgi:glycosyltransferase involved in cell wall biosynthesis